ncbi:MAG TPA: hypothetical protein VGK06_10890 [Methanosarcina sp.]
MTEDTKIAEDISKLRSNIAKIEEIVNKANTIKGDKRNLLKEAKEDKLFPKDEIKKFSTDIENFDKIAIDKALIKKAKAKLIKLELEMVLKEYTILQEEYTKTYSEIENQITD